MQAQQSDLDLRVRLPHVQQPQSSDSDELRHLQQAPTTTDFPEAAIKTVVRKRGPVHSRPERNNRGLRLHTLGREMQTLGTAQEKTRHANACPQLEPD